MLQRTELRIGRHLDFPERRASISRCAHERELDQFHGTPLIAIGQRHGQRLPGRSVSRCERGCPDVDAGGVVRPTGRGRREPERFLGCVGCGSVVAHDHQRQSPTALRLAVRGIAPEHLVEVVQGELVSIGDQVSHAARIQDREPARLDPERVGIVIDGTRIVPAGGPGLAADLADVGPRLPPASALLHARITSS